MNEFDDLDDISQYLSLLCSKKGQAFAFFIYTYQNHDFVVCFQTKHHEARKAGDGSVVSLKSGVMLGIRTQRVNPAAAALTDHKMTRWAEKPRYCSGMAWRVD